jgi:predicted ATPase
MQADLADLFISGIKSKPSNHDAPRLIIETHSEYLLNRLRRRIAEGIVSNDDVGLYFVERSKTAQRGMGSEVRNVEISRGGAFEWPMEFFEETLEDTLQFLELQD